ncbi:hypothetical protein [Streptomyces pratensis]
MITHPYWATLSGPDRVAARTALKHVHDAAGTWIRGPETSSLTGR